MSKQHLSPNRTRELAVFRYRNALDHGDFETVAAVLKLAEIDPLLWAMIDDMAAFDEPPDARLQTTNGHTPTQSKAVQQHITVVRPSTNGHTPKSEPMEGDIQASETVIADQPKTLYPFATRFLTLAAAVLMVVLAGGLLIEMVSDPVDGYPALVDATVTPPCMISTDDPQTESARLGVEADKVMDKERRAGREVAALLAICGLKTSYSPEADSALQRSLNMLDAVPTFPDHDWGYNTTVFSPDGQKLLVGGAYEAVLWDIATHSILHSFVYERAGGDRVNPVAFSPDGYHILTYHQNGIVRLWNAITGEAIRDLDFGTASQATAPAVSSMAFSPDGAQILLGLVEGQVQVWNITAGKLERAFQAGDSNISSMAYTPDGQAILTDAQRETSARLWDAATGAEIRAFSGHTLSINSAALSTDGRFVLTAGQEGTAILHDTATGEQLHIFTGFEDDVNVVAFSPDGRYALIGSADLTARVYDLKSGAEIRRFTLNDNFVASAAFSPDGNRVMLGSVTGNVRLWPTSIEETIKLACAAVGRDLSYQERQQYGLGSGAACENAPTTTTCDTSLNAMAEAENSIGAGDYTAAMTAYQCAIEADPTNYGAYLMRGGLAGANGNYDQLGLDYYTFITHNPANPSTDNVPILAILPTLRDAIAARPDDPVLYILRGLVLTSAILDQPEDMVYLREIMPDNAVGYLMSWNWPYAYDPNDPNLLKAIDLAPDSAMLIIVLARGLTANNAAFALPYFERAIEANPAHPFAYEALGRAYTLLGDTAAASSFYQHIQVTPTIVEGEPLTLGENVTLNTVIGTTYRLPFSAEAGQRLNVTTINDDGRYTPTLVVLNPDGEVMDADYLPMTFYETIPVIEGLDITESGVYNLLIKSNDSRTITIEVAEAP